MNFRADDLSLIADKLVKIAIDASNDKYLVNTADLIYETMRLMDDETELKFLDIFLTYLYKGLKSDPSIYEYVDEDYQPMVRNDDNIFF
jgi:hypothetical protein